MKKLSKFIVVLLLSLNALQAQNVIWGNAEGQGGNDRSLALTTDATGNVYTTGFQVGTSSDIYVQKTTASGTVLWTKLIGNTGDDRGSSIVVDGSGNVFVTGYFSGTVDFDLGAGTSNLVSAGAADIFILKLNSAGNFVWANRYGGTNADEGKGITLDASGNIYATGYFLGTNVNFGGTNLTAASNDPFVIKLNTTGATQWAVSATGTGTIDQGRSIRWDAGGGVTVGGVFNSQMDMDPSGTTSNITPLGTGYEPFIWKLTEIGGFWWAKNFGNASNTNDEINAIDVDATNNIYVTGYFQGSVDFDPSVATTNVTALGADGFVSKFDQYGNFAWVKTWGNSNTSSNPLALDVASNGNIYIGGAFNGGFFAPQTVDFDPSLNSFPLSNGSGSNYPFMMKLNSSGGFISAFSLENGYSATTGIIADASGNFYVSGYFYQSGVDLDPWSGYFPLFNPNNGTEHVFTAKYDTCFTPPFTFIASQTIACPGQPITLNLSNSVIGNNYRVYRNGVAFGTTTAGTGSALNINVSGLSNNDTLTIYATNGVCIDSMLGRVIAFVGSVNIDSGLVHHYRLDNNFKDEKMIDINNKKGSIMFMPFEVNEIQDAKENENNQNPFNCLFDFHANDQLRYSLSKSWQFK